MGTTKMYSDSESVCDTDMKAQHTKPVFKWIKCISLEELLIPL